MIDLETLDSRFGISDQLVFKKGPGGEDLIEVSNQTATATIVLQGAHLIHWAPRDAKPVIWLSPDATFAPGKSIRGGIPICWPWFGAHASRNDVPAHGFARTVQWHVINTGTMADGTTQILFELEENDTTRSMWPESTRAQYKLTIGNTLELELITANTGDTPVTIGEALHTYFAIKDIRNIRITGLEGCEYLDKVEDFKQKHQFGAITFDSEVDRVYIDTDADCVIDDPDMGRSIRIRKRDSHSTVVWNPWIEKAEQMGDLGEDGYLQMVCVESANAAKNVITLAPGEEHTLHVEYSLI